MTRKEREREREREKGEREREGRKRGLGEGRDPAYRDRGWRTMTTQRIYIGGVRVGVGIRVAGGNSGQIADY
jgi:hypothetical protein